MLSEASARTKAKKEVADSLEGVTVIAPTIQRKWSGVLCLLVESIRLCTCIVSLYHVIGIASFPGPLIHGEGPGTHCMCMRENFWKV